MAEKMEVEIVEESLPVAQAATPADLLKIAVSQDMGIEKLEKLMELQERWEANEARKAYVAAMAEFKKNPPKIIKDILVSFETSSGTTTYKHANLANAANLINTELSRYGLSAAWKTDQEKKIKVTCTITHSLGHSESTALEADADASGKKNPIQAIGSTVTYLQRYTLFALTGLAAHNQDDDGKGADMEPISDKQFKAINDLIKERDVDISLFLAYMEVESLEEIPAKKYHQALAGLKVKQIKERV